MGTIFGVFGDHINEKNHIPSSYVDREFQITAYLLKSYGRLGQFCLIFEKVNVAIVVGSRGLDQSQRLLLAEAPSGCRFRVFSPDSCQKSDLSRVTTGATTGGTKGATL